MFARGSNGSGSAHSAESVREVDAGNYLLPVVVIGDVMCPPAEHADGCRATARGDCSELSRLKRFSELRLGCLDRQPLR